MTLLERLRDELSYVEAALQHIHRDAVDDGGEARSLTDDEQSAWDEGVAFVEATRSRIQREEQRESVISSITPARSEGSWSSINVNTRTATPFDLSDLPAYGEARNREVRSRAIDVVAKSRRFVEDGHRERATQILERVGYQPGLAELTLLRSSDVYADGFLRMAFDPGNVTPEQRAAVNQVKELQRAMALSDVTGVLVPAHLDPTLILSNDGTTNPFRRVCRVETGTTNVFTSVTSAGVTASWDAEAAEVSDDAPSFSNPTATAYKGAAFVPISVEAFEDAMGRESEIVMAIMDAKDRLESAAFATGNGTTAPRGLVTALDANTNVEVSTTTSNVFGIEDVYALYEALPARWRNNRTTWFANLAIINDIRQFGTDNYNTQTVQLGAMSVPAVLGHAILESSEMDGTIAVAGTDNILVVGDPQQYLIYDRIGLSVELIPHLFATANNLPSGQRGWYAHWRTGANTTVDTAFRLLQAETNS